MPPVARPSLAPRSARTAASLAPSARSKSAKAAARRGPGRAGRGQPGPLPPRAAGSDGSTSRRSARWCSSVSATSSATGAWCCTARTAQLHAPWALAIAARLRERYGGMDVQAQHTDDGIVRVPDADDPPPAGYARPGRGRADRYRGGGPVGAVRLQVPRVQPGAAAAAPAPGRRIAGLAAAPAVCAASLLAVASQYSQFPIALETMRECLQDVFDVPGLTALMRGIATRHSPVWWKTPRYPRSAGRRAAVPVCGRVHVRGRHPLAERRAQALALDFALLVELLGQTELRELLDPAVVEETGREPVTAHPWPGLPGTLEAVADMLRALGPLTTDEVADRSADPAQAACVARWTRCCPPGDRGAHRGHSAVEPIEDAGRLRVDAPSRALRACLMSSPSWCLTRCAT